MLKEFFDYAKKWGIFAVLFCSLLLWTMNTYERRETEYIKHEQEYHKIVSDSQRIIMDNQVIMKEYQKQLQGFKEIIDIRLSVIQQDVANIKKQF